MSDIGKLQRPETGATIDPAELAQDAPVASLDDPAAARQRAGGELKYRASGGAGGVAPMQRLMDERRAIGGQLAARVQRKANGAPGSVAIPESGGAKLPDAVRARMEPKLGADLADVQVHTGGASAQAAAGLGARAFTVGSDVHFNAGEFAPGSKEGDRLLAHELTHVVQGQKSGVQRKPADPNQNSNSNNNASDNAAAGGAANANAASDVSHPDEPAEKEADAVADGVTDSLHGGGDKKAAGAKGKDKDGRTGAHALGAEAFTDGNDVHLGGGGGQDAPAHEAWHVSQQSAGHVAGSGGAAAGPAPAEKPAPISAKYIGIGRKIFRKPDPATAGAASPASAPAAAAQPKPETPEDTLSSDQFKEFQKRYSSLMASLQMPDDPAGCQKIWLEVVRTLQATNPAFANAPKVDPKNPKSRTELRSAAVQKIISEFDPIVAKLTPLMEKFTKGKKLWAFWSGKAADSVAKANSEVCLEKSALGSLFDGINITGKWDTQMWASLSRAYATHAAKDAEQKTYRGFVGMGSSAEQSIFNKIEQPQFVGMLDQKVAASVKITWYAVAFDPTDAEQKRADEKCNAAGITGVIGSAPDRASMVAMAEDINGKRLKLYQRTNKVVPPDQVNAALADAEKAPAAGAAASDTGSSSRAPAAKDAKPASSGTGSSTPPSPATGPSAPKKT